MDGKVRLRSSDGLIFETSPEVACLSPIVAELRDLHDEDDEVPLPTVRGNVLAQVLDLCERYIAQGTWDALLLRHISKDTQQLEQIAWAADYLGMEQLMGLCLGSLARMVKEQGPRQACVSVIAMRRSLQLQSLCLPNEIAAAVLEWLTLHAARGNQDIVAAVRMYLGSSSPTVRRAAIIALGRLAPIGDANSIARLTEHLADQDATVQLATLDAVSQIVARGNESVISIVKERCLNGDAATRCVAMEAVGRVAVQGVAHTIAVARQGMADSNGHVRKLAVESYAQLVHQGDEYAALELIKCLEDMDETVRQAAIHAVGMTFDKGSSMAMGALSERLEHRYWWVSWAAAKVLGDYAPKDEPNIVNAVLARLGHASPSIRQVAGQALAQVASKGNKRVVEGLAVHLQHSDSGVREDAVKTFGKFGSGEDDAIKALSALLEHPKQKVRKSVLDALKLVVTTGAAQAQEEVSKHLNHKNAEVRLNALLALSEFANRNDHCIIEATCQALLDKDGQVQDGAVSMFNKMVDSGHPHAIFTLLGLLDVGDLHSLKTTISMMPIIVGSSEQAFLLMSTLLEQQSVLVRSAVFDMFMQMHDRHYRPSVLAKCSCWERGGSEQQVFTSDRNGESELEKVSASERAGVRTATQALTSCLLRPSIRFHDAVAAAFQRAGGCGDRVVASLNTCMSSRRWFMRWQTVELLCRTSSAPGSAETTCSTTSAKIERRPHKSKKRPLSPVGEHGREKIAHTQPLHRPGCPCIADSKLSKRPSKRAIFGGA
jgi:HEAT repeat protein